MGSGRFPNPGGNIGISDRQVERRGTRVLRGEEE